MLKTCLIFIIFLFQTNGYSNTVKFEDLTLVQGVYTYKGIKFNGTAVKKDDISIQEIPLKKGVINGIKKEFLILDNQKYHIKSQSFADNVLNGKSTFYFPSGIVSYTGEFKNGAKEGIHNHYLDDGQLWKVFSYKKGVLEGKCVTFHENGKILKEDYYKEGKYHGVCKEFHENGKLKSETNFHSGKRLGIHREYNKAGTLIVDENYSDHPFN